MYFFFASNDAARTSRRFDELHVFFFLLFVELLCLYFRCRLLEKHLLLYLVLVFVLELVLVPLHDYGLCN